MKTTHTPKNPQHTVTCLYPCFRNLFDLFSLNSLLPQTSSVLTYGMFFFYDNRTTLITRKWHSASMWSVIVFSKMSNIYLEYCLSPHIWQCKCHSSSQCLSLHHIDLFFSNKSIIKHAGLSVCQITAAWTGTFYPLVPSSWWPSPVFQEPATPGLATS